MAALAGGPDFIDADRDAERGIGLLPDLRVCPIIGFICAVDDRIEGRVDFPALQNILGLLMGLIADAVGVRTGGGNQEVERLHPGIAGALGHDIKELPVGLGMQLVEHHTVDIEAVLGICLRRQHLIEAVGGLIDDSLLGGQDFHSLIERRTHTHHVGGHVENNGRLLAVSCAAIDLGPLLAITAGEQQRNGSGQLRFAHLLRNLHIGRVELPVAVGLENAEQVADNLLLPVDEFKGRASPGALGVAQALDEIHRVIRSVLIVDRVLGLECCGLIFLQLSQIITSNGHKK